MKIQDRRSGHLIIQRGLIASVLLLAVFVSACMPVRRILTDLFSGSYGASDGVTEVKAEFTGADSVRQRINISLTRVASGFNEPTDIQFDPSNPNTMIVLEKTGRMRWFDVASKETGNVMSFDVATVSEQGLLGMAFHPDYPRRPLLYVNLTPDSGNISRVLEIRLPEPANIQSPGNTTIRTVMEVEQPYQNHNAGQLVFGPDGYLFIGWGDGGWIGDPHDNGQNPSVLLGKMLRIDPAPVEGRAYTIPHDNPFVGVPLYQPEIWATGLRNPWRYTFDPHGRLIAPDVGQNTWEEINIIEKGGNYGWRCREGLMPYDTSAGCTAVLSDPFYVYGHDEGLSVTGGYVYTGNDISALTGLYVFGDFISGRIWALKLPEHPNTLLRTGDIYALGQWPVQISTFGRDADGRVYLADYGRGIIYRIDNP